MALNMTEDRVVCVVDDDEAVRDSICVLLQSEGLSARAFASAPEFLNDPLARSAACFVFDVHMPDMNGIELLAFLRNGWTVAPVILLTGGADLSVIRAARDAGASAVLSKPDGDLLAMIRELLELDR
jgi:FixJ family two-component response regulator